jgi:DHA3 family tetracycline resistance protein-like MFS transporter
MKLAVFRSLRQRSFLLLWLGQTVSRLGDSMHRIALILWVLETTGSGFAMGTVVICQTVPMIVFLLIGGVAVDRFDRLRIMLGSDVVRGGLTLGMAILAFSGHLELWHLYIASALFGFVDAFFQPAYAAFVPTLVTNENLPSANAVTALSAQATRVLGPAIGAIIVAFSGPPLVFLIDGISFMACAVFLLPLMNKTFSQPPPQSVDEDFLGLEMASSGFTDLGAGGLGTVGGGTVTFIQSADLNLDDVGKKDERSTIRKVLDEAREGFKVVIAEPWLWVAIVVMAFINCLDVSAYILAMPYLLKESLHLDIAYFGMLQSIGAVGMVLASLWLGNRSKLRRRGLMFYGAAFVIALCTLAFAAPITIVGICVAVVLRAMASVFIDLVFVNSVQEMVAPEKLGRVYSIESFGSTLLMPLGFAGIGWATDHFTPESIFAAVGASGILIAALALRHPRIRTID